MKKVSGLLMLLLVVFLVSMPVVAESFGMSNEAALGLTFEETKIIPEEVIAASGDVTAIPAAPPSYRLGSDLIIFIVAPDAGFEAGSSGIIAGGVRVYPGYCRS